MRVWEGYTILNLLQNGKDAEWVVAIIVICITTFAVSSIFVKGGAFAKFVRRSLAVVISHHLMM